MKTSHLIAFTCAVLMFGKVVAEEGMWLPQLLQSLNEQDMKKNGMKINATDIYSINKGSLKDAIVSLGGFCTAEVISDQGLLLTNHHCGFDAIQNHSTLKHNYLRDGFWSKNFGEELTNPGLTATFIIRIDDVTDSVLKNTAGLTENERQAIINQNMVQVRKNARKESYQDVLLRPFFEGNKYYLFILETYKDVRLVGAPPSAIGNFGKDTDNWMWPRHTGDFSLFRIYADANNHPAEYSPNNVAYKPKRALNISLDGVAENDFTMVFGFPGRTSEYLHSAAVTQIMNVNDPIKIAIRGKALEIMKNYMLQDELIKIQYAAKYASIENAYKKWQGEVLGLKKSKAVDKKKAYEAQFANRVMMNRVYAKYGSLLNDLETSYKEFEPYGLTRDIQTEVVGKIDLLNIAGQLLGLIRNFDKNGLPGYNKARDEVAETLSGIYREYNKDVDQKLFEELMVIYVKNMKPECMTPSLTALVSKHNDNYHDIAAEMFTSSVLHDSTKVLTWLALSPQELAKKMESDAAVALVRDMQKTYSEQVSGRLTELQATINNLQRQYMTAQMDVFKERKFYPDANSTLRVTYGKVKGYAPRDGMEYKMFTYLDGVMEKYVPGDYEFDLPAKLIDLYNNKDYGQYGVDGRQPVCFIATNHTTGGNSGSPALDAYGNLIGLNFDRVWEGTMSDINYDPHICRNIMVDIRYVAFIIDKFANAQNIINELKFVHPKKKTQPLNKAA